MKWELKQRIVMGMSFLLASCTSVTEVREERQTTSLPPSDKIQIIASQDRRLQLEPCGCSIRPLGGSDREKKIVLSLRAENPNTFQFVTGQTFSGYPDATKIGNKKLKALFHKTLKFYEEINPKAIMVSSEDLAAWPELKKIAKKKTGLFVSSNIVNSLGKPLFEPLQVITLEKSKLVVLSFASEKQSTQTGDWKVLPWKVALKQLKPQWESIHPNAVVVLSQATPVEVVEMAKEFNVPSIFVGGVSGSSYYEPQQFALSSLQLVPLAEGKSVSVLNFKLSSETASQYFWQDDERERIDYNCKIQEGKLENVGVDFLKMYPACVPFRKPAPNQILSYDYRYEALDVHWD